MDATRFTNLEATGGLKVGGKAELGEAEIGTLKAEAIGCALTATVISKADSYALADAEKTAYIGATMTAASKTLTLGLPDNAVCFVVNEGGTNAFTLKNVSGDSGTSIAAGKAALVRASKTANGTKVYVLN